MTKPLARSELASEANWRPKQPQRICLKKSGRSLNLLSTSFNLPEKIRMVFCQQVFFSQQTQLIRRSEKISPSKWPAAGILGPNLVCLFIFKLKARGQHGNLGALVLGHVIVMLSGIEQGTLREVTYLVLEVQLKKEIAQVFSPQFIKTVLSHAYLILNCNCS